MIVSSFELLVKPIAPAPFDPNVSRRVVQAYFLQISNLNSPESADVALSLQFIATPVLNNAELIAITDNGSGNVFSDLVPDPMTGIPSQQLTLASGTTTLFVLQPDITQMAPNKASLATADLEVRGYVQLELSRFSPSGSAELLVTPQIRGTFLPANLNDPNPDFDQQAYTLPGGIIKLAKS
ncbi:MAG: hypothetical protein ACFB8W_10505 [Elainellaceae cyanobacterium]